MGLIKVKTMRLQRPVLSRENKQQNITEGMIINYFATNVYDFRIRLLLYRIHEFGILTSLA